VLRKFINVYNLEKYLGIEFFSFGKSMKNIILITIGTKGDLG
jgi:hypothetical protein